MKKFTILLFFVSISVFVYGQTLKTTSPVSLSSLLEKNPIPSTIPPAHGKAVVRNKTNYRGGLITVPLGSSANAYTTLLPESHNVTSDSALNTVIFIHRNNNILFENNTSHYRYDVSFDGGNTFTNDLGPLNPNCKDSTDWYNSRYPQVAIQEYSGGAGSITADSSYLVYEGAWHDGTSTTSNTIWNGIVTGAEQLTGNSATDSEADSTMDNGNTLISSSMCKGLPGQFWAVDQEQSGYFNDSIVIVYRGFWNEATKTVNWRVYARLNPHYRMKADSTYKLTPLIAFDPSGNIGWVSVNGDFGGASEGSFTPCFFNTSDGGVTWTGPYVCNMDSIPCIANYLTAPIDGGSGIPMSGFDVSLAVDKLGVPHMFSVVGSADTLHAILSSLNMNLYDFNYDLGEKSWSVTRIDTIYALRGTIGYIGGNTSDGSDAYTQDNRPQVSVTSDGSKVLFIWVDSPGDVTLGLGNANPDLYGAGYDVDSKLWTPTYNYSVNDNTWSGMCTFHCVSPISLYSGGVTTVPVVITQLGIDGISQYDPNEPAYFYYFSNINFTNSAFTIDKSSCVLNVTGINDVKKADNTIDMYPNPADNQIVISSTSGLNNTTISVYNILGEVVLTDKMGYNSSYTINTQSFTDGVYTVSFVNGTTVSTKQFVVSH